MLERTLGGIVSLPFAGPSAAFVLSEAELPESREILVIAHRHHFNLIEAIERGEGARAESLAREHAQLALTNLEIVLRHRELLERLPGASLLVAPADGRAPDRDSVPSIGAATGSGLSHSNALTAAS